MDIDLYADDEREYLYDHQRAMSELSVWMHKNRPLGEAFVLVKVEGGFEIAITEHRIHHPHQCAFSCRRTTGCLFWSGAFLDHAGRTCFLSSWEH